MEATTGSTRKGEVIIPTPKGFIALRVIQIILALVIVAMTGWWIHGLYYDELGFVIVCVCVFPFLSQSLLFNARIMNHTTNSPSTIHRASSPG